MSDPIDETISADDTPLSPTEQRLKQRLIVLQVHVNRLQDQVKKLVLVVGIAGLVGGVGGVAVYNVATDARHETLVNRSQGLGNRALLCLATNAPGNDLPPDVIEKIRPLCDKDFTGAR
jgi:hypothetical protein